MPTAVSPMARTHLTVRRHNSRRTHLLYIWRKSKTFIFERSQPRAIKVDIPSGTWWFASEPEKRFPIGECIYDKAKDEHYYGVVGVIDRLSLNQLNEALRLAHSS